MKRVVVESPYGSPDPKIIERNVRYARACLRDCLMRGEAPIASHLLYTQPGVLHDAVSEDRKLGIEAGLVWGAQGELSAVYVDLGITSGMEWGMKRAGQEGRPVEHRHLPPEVLEKVLHPERPLVSTDGVCEVWRGLFITFVQTGEASPSTLLHLDNCKGCQEALAREFVKLSGGLQAMAKFMEEERKKK